MDKQAYIEKLHNSGKMPDWYYYQVNGRTFQENYDEIRKNRYTKHNETIEEVRKKIEKALEKTIMKYL